MAPFPRVLVALVVALTACAGLADVRVAYRYPLSDTAGRQVTFVMRMHHDPVRDELYVLESRSIRIFNPSGMQTYTYVVPEALGAPLDFAVDPSGDALVLCIPNDRRPGAATFTIERLDYRGAHESSIAPRLPDTLSAFAPAFMGAREGLLYFVSSSGLRALVLREDGGFVRSVDLAPLLEVAEKDRQSVQIGGFSIDHEGNFLFTMPERFRAFVVAPDWTPKGDFGRASSSAGGFGVVAGILRDERGYFYVADKGRSLVLIFAPDFAFVREFGGYGGQAENLVRPDMLALSPSGKLFVTQMKGRGVSVFEVATGDAAGGATEARP